MSQKLTISINPRTAELTFIYSDLLQPLLKEGKAEIRRVSNVEPCEGGWSATMEDKTVLGPYKLREEALNAEIAYIEKNLLKGQALLCKQTVSAPGWSLACDHPKSMHDPKTGRCTAVHEFNWGDSHCNCEGFKAN